MRVRASRRSLSGMTDNLLSDLASELATRNDWIRFPPERARNSNHQRRRVSCGSSTGSGSGSGSSHTIALFVLVMVRAFVVVISECSRARAGRPLIARLGCERQLD